MITDVVILAAGKGTRMRSALPKVLQDLAGRPLLEHVLESAQALSDLRKLHVVLGHGAEAVRARFEGWNLHWWLQEGQRGTGDAVAAAAAGFADAQRVLVLYGDVPLLQTETLQAFLDATPGEQLGILTGVLADPRGYGRILRDSADAIVGIREDRDCRDERERAIVEVNLGVMILPVAPLMSWLARLQPHNAQGEIYLTDVVALAVADGVEVRAFGLVDPSEAAGVNDPIQLEAVERLYQKRQLQRLMLAGLRVRDASRVDIRGAFRCGTDCILDVNVICEGRVQLGNRVRVGAGVLLKDVSVDDDVEILPYSVIDGANLGPGARIGPFARIRPHSVVGAGAHIGNFVEVKAVELGAGSKANHLSYLGDARIGAGVNVGAGVITCNYDGANKHRTEIGDAVFIGSDSQLIAPLRVGSGATIGAGSTITRDVPEGGLSLSRSPQRYVAHWQRPVKKAKD
ncbi:MAG: bifunctional UDP-N-acetylglucosamine diphosphorylase/glucosamine-1-phosphate N-acetyltransferase GlmU [Acidithiobacillus caldus]|nr:bifunctional UDP-N-acetylglucosamine diphosphorylase/glucosamine-1-phosphate N-acetyltransferase GlmU [Acidithiobacillus caldus]